jgi:hypothetical protein
MSENALDVFILKGIKEDSENFQVKTMKNQLKKEDPLKLGDMMNFIALEGAMKNTIYDLEVKKAKEVAEKYM